MEKKCLERFAAIEIDDFVPEVAFVESGNAVDGGVAVVRLSLVEFGSIGASGFVFGGDGVEGGLGGGFSGECGGVAGVGAGGTVKSVLNLFVERALIGFEVELALLHIETGLAHIVSGGVPIEDGDIELQSDVLREVILELTRKTEVVHTGRSVIIRSHPCGQ